MHDTYEIVLRPHDRVDVLERVAVRAAAQRCANTLLRLTPMFVVAAIVLPPETEVPESGPL